jgi:hypothetical protein
MDLIFGQTISPLHFSVNFQMKLSNVKQQNGNLLRLTKC